MPSIPTGLPIASLLDASVLLVVLVAAFFGYRAGFARGIWSVVGWVGPIWFALAFQKDTARIFAPVVNAFGMLNFLTNALAFAGLVAAGHFVFVMAGQLVVDPLVARVLGDRVRLARVDHYLGPLPAMARVLVITGAVLTTAASLARADDVAMLMRTSVLARPLVAATSSTQVAMAQDIADREAAPFYDIGRALSSTDDATMPVQAPALTAVSTPSAATPAPSTVIAPQAAPAPTQPPAPTVPPTARPVAPTAAPTAPPVARSDPNAWRQPSPCALTTTAEIRQMLGLQTGAGALEDNPGEPGVFPPRLTCTFQAQNRTEAVVVFVEPASSWPNTVASVMNYERFSGLGQAALVKDGYVGSEYFVLIGTRVISVDAICAGCDRSMTLALTRLILGRLP